jgi:DNA (cytosine-5)-methyltransferase 1
VTFRFLSICSGVEAASLAFGPLGWTAAGFAEIAAFPSAVLAARFGSNLPGEPLSRNAPQNYGDFTMIDPRAVGRLDVLCGGTPCQAFSIAGRRGSLADARGNLTLAFVRLAHELVAHAGLRNAIWENVPGALSLDDNAFGCFLGELVGADDPLLPGERPGRGKSSAGWRWDKDRHVPRWPRAGMVAGPLGRAAWRVLDAQYFGLPQRRERIVLVADFGNGADPAEVLFEPKSLRGDIAKGRGKREGIAGSLTASSGKRGGVPQADASENLIVEPASGLRLREMQRDERGDLVSDLRMVRPRAWGDLGAGLTISHALRGEGFDASEDGTGRGTPIVPVCFGGNDTRGPIDVAAALNAHGGPSGRLDFDSETVIVAPEIADTLTAYWERSKGAKGGNAAGLLNPIIEAPICFDTTQITSTTCRSNPQPGDPSHSLAASSHPPAVAFDLRGRGGGAQFEGPHDTANIRAASGGSSRSYVAEHWAVRRLTPLECERLQGIPDGWTAIETRGKPAADGPRYAAIGNSWAVPVFAWVGARLDAALRAMESPR